MTTTFADDYGEDGYEYPDPRELAQYDLGSAANPTIPAISIAPKKKKKKKKKNLKFEK
jgi:hypothetical protein